MTSNAASSTTNASDILHMLADLDDCERDDAIQSHGWSVVTSQILARFRHDHPPANFRDVVAGLEAWLNAKMELPAEPAVGLVLAFCQGTLDALLTARLDMTDDHDAEVEWTLGMRDKFSAALKHPTVRAAYDLTDGVRAAMIAESMGDTADAWGCITDAVADLAKTAYRKGGDELAETLAEALRVVARKAAQS